MGNALWRTLSGPLLPTLMAVVPVVHIVGLVMYLLAAGVLLPPDAPGTGISCGVSRIRDLGGNAVDRHAPEQWSVPCR